MLGFGLLSLVLGEIQFYIPDIGGGSSELCEVAILLSVVFLPHWIYVVGVSIILALGTPTEGSIPIAIFMHSVAGIYAWYFYSFIRKHVKKVYYLGFSWVLLVVVYYSVFLIPAAIIGSYLAGITGNMSAFILYKKVFATSTLELFTTTLVTTLFILLNRLTNILEAKNRQLSSALAKAKESDRLKSAFLSNMSHEIRTPMNGIIGFCSLLTEPNLPVEKRKDYSEIIINSSNQLLSIINDILDISRIEAGMAEVNNTHVIVDSLLKNIESFYTPKALEKNLKFVVISRLNTEHNNILTDRGKLQEIIDNLVSNAFKFTDEGYVTLSCEKTGEQIRFYVEDSGIGIEESFHSKVFERFSQVDFGDSRTYRGTGLGLSITKGLVELLGGQIEFSSTLGKGSIFSFTIPYIPYYPEPPNNLNNDMAAFAHDVLANVKILIAEDETVNYQYLVELFTGSKAIIYHASNGKEAVSICKEHPELNFILMDIKMPLMNGLEATRQIRKFRPNLPIIAQTAYALSGDWKLALEAGCTDYLAKPITKKSILDSIAKHVRI